MDLTPHEKEVLDQFCSRTREAFGSRVRELVLFGSRARGEGHEDSDVDVCVVIDDLDWREKRDVFAITGDLLAKHDVLISAFVVSTAHMNHLRARERLIAREIESEGVRL